jgi:hypothetical protein
VVAECRNGGSRGDGNGRHDHGSASDGLRLAVALASACTAGDEVVAPGGTATVGGWNFGALAGWNGHDGDGRGGCAGFGHGTLVLATRAGSFGGLVSGLVDSLGQCKKD